jgi:hypothetical protein
LTRRNFSFRHLSRPEPGLNRAEVGWRNPDEPVIEQSAGAFLSPRKAVEAARKKQILRFAQDDTSLLRIRFPTD